MLPVWKTTPNAALYRDAGLSSALIALEEAKMRFAAHLHTIDAEHPLARRTEIPLIRKGRGAGNHLGLEPKYKGRTISYRMFPEQLWLSHTTRGAAEATQREDAPRR